MNKLPVVNAFKSGVLHIWGEDAVNATFNGTDFISNETGEIIKVDPKSFHKFVQEQDVLKHEVVLSNLTSNSNENVVLIYHGGCPDGVASAVVAMDALGRDLTTIAGHYARPLTEENVDLEGKTVVLCDFSYPLEEMQKIVSKAYRVIFIDHHKTPLESLAALLSEQNVFAFSSTHYSGASLTWQFFNPEKDMPVFIKYIEDGDLYKFSLPESRDIVKGFHAILKKEIFDNLYLLRECIDLAELEQIRQIGEKINGEAHRQAKGIIKQGRMTAMAYGHTFPVINATPDHTNLVGELIYTSEDVPFVMIYTILANRVKISLRSNANAVDVAELAQRIFVKGGGHKNAAAGFMPFDQFHKEVLANAVEYVAPVAEEKATCTCEHH
mgnify:CR=1 FL=1